MQPQPIISVIIPVFNTAGFLHECIDSILQQSFTELEIVLVDDGSTDNSWQIIQGYCQNYPTIHGYQQTRQGQGPARNEGLRHAKGQYIGFVDSDDTLPPNGYKQLYGLARKNSSDLVVGIQQSFNGKRTWRGVPAHTKHFKHDIDITDIQQAPYLLEDTSCCNKIIKRELILRHSISFPASAREDLDFMARVFVHATRVSVLSKVVYNYRGRSGSDTGSLATHYFHDWVSLLEQLQTYYLKNNSASIYPALLKAEVKKLVTHSRFTRIIRLAPYADKQIIFSLFTKAVNTLTHQDIACPGKFTPREQLRILLLKSEEYDALLQFEKNPWAPSFLQFLQHAKDDSRLALLQKPLLDLYAYQITNLKQATPQGHSSPTGRRALRHFLKKRLHPLREALNRREKASPPWKALLYYSLLFPVVAIHQRLFKKRRSVWLIDERLSKSAEDNGFFLFAYLRQTYPSLPVYFVIKKDSPTRHRLKGLGNTLEQYSLAHAYSLLHAKVLLSTDSLRSLAFPCEIFRRLWSKTHNVFLQHGVMAMKWTVYSHQRYSYLSQVITSSQREKKLFIQDYHFPEETVSVTGLARFDNLARKQEESRRQILVAPTWRLDLRTREEVRGSKYFWAWQTLLTHPELSDLLHRHNTSLLFRPHQNMLPLIGDLMVETDRIQVQQDLSFPLFQSIKDSSLLITDYSSILFDFLYQNKPAITFMFDRKEIECSPRETPHIDIDVELPADIHVTPKGVLSSLAGYLANNFTLSDRQRAKADVFFAHRDDGNCERIYQAISKRIN